MGGDHDMSTLFRNLTTTQIIFTDTSPLSTYTKLAQRYPRAVVAVMTDARSSWATIAVHVPEESDGDILIPELAGSSQAPAVQIHRRAGTGAKFLYCCYQSKPNMSGFTIFSQ